MTNDNNTPVEAQESGQINIAEEVIANIASIAAAEVEGLAGVKQGGMADIVGIFGGKQKGVEVHLNDLGQVQVSLKVTVAYGHPIHEVARSIQEKVTHDINAMTGLDVQGVDVYVKDLKLTSDVEEVAEESEALTEATEE